MPDRRLLELEDQINFLLKGPKPVPRASSTNVPQEYAKAISSNLYEPPWQNSFTFHERVRPNPQPEAPGTNFEARVRDYMTAHTERMERFENAIFKQREEINDKMAEIIENNGTTDKSVAETSKFDEQKPPKEVNKPNEGGRRADDDLVKGERENVIKNEEEGPAGVSRSMR
ncbi:hypothetical protein Tco_1044392 [Tanacetum coccineum]|uniref:Uncharacterized protein n=1 Tax=Tanacetum coccineum TaxID=301880 RepID=A0ABQ5GRS7_9ASTR